MPTSDLTGSSRSTIAEILAKLGTDPNRGLNPAQVQELLDKYGPNALAEEKKSALSAFLVYFWGPIPWMIEAAALMALIVKDWGDFTIITSLLLFNALLGFWEEHEASNALDALKSSLALKARVLRGGKWEQVDARMLVPGDIIRLYLGDVVPADCKLIQGDYVSIDQSALTGESLPVTKRSGEDAYSGSVVKQGEMIAVITATGANTFFGRTAKLVATAGSVSHFQRAVMKIGNFLIILALVLVVILVASRLFDMRGHYDRAVLLRLAEIVLILLVASVPVAMPAVLSVTMALGARMLARSKAIVSRLESIEELAGVDVLCSDKTGTLTQNKLTLGEPAPWTGADAATLVLMASLASRAADNDPIDLAVLAGLKDPSILKSYQQEKYVPFDPVNKRTEATVKDASGKVFRVTKGAPQVILALTKLSGSDLEKANQTVNGFASRGYRTIGVAVGQGDGPWVFQGILPLLDPPRPDSKSTIAKARAYGVKVKMVTGDNVAIARQIASELPIILSSLDISSQRSGAITYDLAAAKGSGAIDLFLLFGFLLGIWAVPKFGRIPMQAIGFASMACGMLLLMIAVRLSNSSLHIPLVFTGFILFNLLMNAGPNSTTFTLAPILFPTQLRATASGFAAAVAKIGASFGVFVLPILKGKFGIPAVLGMVVAVSVLGLVVTLVFGREDTE